MNYAAAEAIKRTGVSPLGLWVAIGIIGLWFGSLALGLRVELDFTQPGYYLWFLVQTHLYAGIFITAHDAMHGIVHPNSKVNRSIGWLCATLFAFNFYPKLLKNHHLHHQLVGTKEDPDVHHGNFWSWYVKFLRAYLSIYQFVLMGVTYNVLKLFFLQENILFFWIFPAVLATLQIFYFGTYLPHRRPPNNPHFAHTLQKNHFWAFITCYFFGYHFEHHEAPYVPWWQLFRLK